MKIRVRLRTGTYREINGRIILRGLALVDKQTIAQAAVETVEVDDEEPDVLNEPLDTETDTNFGDYTVTHIETGLGLVVIDKRDVLTVTKILSTVTWHDLDVLKAFKGQQYREVLLEAMNVTKERLRLAKEAEKQTAHDLGGRVTAASGARQGSKRDGYAEVNLAAHDANFKLRWELKHCEKKSYTLDIADLEFLRKQALEHKEEPAYIILFSGEDRFSVAIIEESLYEEWDTSSRVADCTEAKTLRINSSLRDTLNTGTVQIITKYRNWRMMHYGVFLRITKRHQ